MPTGKPARSRGFAYVFLLVAIALIGLTAGSAVSVGAGIARRDAERQLLTIGMEFQNALRGYAGGGPGPRALEDLLRDPRAPGIRRHLRKIYDDPLSGQAQWGLVTNAGGFIVGIHSLADGEPLQREGFDRALIGFEDATSYKEWIFGLPQAPRLERPPRNQGTPGSIQNSSEKAP